MKKSLVALATLAATSVFAQQLPSGANPNVAAFGNGFRIIGGFDTAYGALNYKGSNKYTGMTYNTTYTSQITMIGIEDLGGGMKADFNYESDINPSTQYNTGVNGLNGVAQSAAAGAGNNTGIVAASNYSGAQAASTWGNGQVKAGLSGAFGYVALGAVNNAGLDYNQMSGPFGTAWGSGYGITQAAVGAGYGSGAKVRYDNSIRYLTPELVPGLIGSYTHRAKNSTAANTIFSATTGAQALSGVQELALIYRQGPVNLIYVNQVDDGNNIRSGTVSDTTGLANLTAIGAKYTTSSFGGNYTTGAFTLYAGYQNQKNDTATVNNKAQRYALKYAATPVLSVAATYNRLSPVTGDTTTVTGLGADYALSKMTSLTFRSERADDKTGGIATMDAVSSKGVVGAGFANLGTNVGTRTRTAVGLRVLF